MPRQNPHRGERECQRIAQEAARLMRESGIHDLEHARRKNHLTARQAGQVARESGARGVVPFHFSPRYGQRAAELVAEVNAAWRLEDAA